MVNSGRIRSTYVAQKQLRLDEVMLYLPFFFFGHKFKNRKKKHGRCDFSSKMVIFGKKSVICVLYFVTELHLQCILIEGPCEKQC